MEAKDLKESEGNHGFMNARDFKLP